MRVALLTAGHTDRRTGGYLYHARIAAELPRHGVQVEQIVASQDASLDGQRRAARDVGRVTQYVLTADVVVIDALAALSVASQLDAWQTDRPLVAMVHELPSVASGDAVPDLWAAEERLLEADRVIAVSRHGMGILLARGVAPARLAIVSPGADRLTVSTVPSEVADDRLAVLCVAQWIPRKGIDTLLRAWLALGRDDATLHLIGETDADPTFAARVRALLNAAVPGSVVVHGVVDDAALAAAYQQAAVFTLPTRYEGYGMVFAEALLHGVPIVTTNVGPVPELVGTDAGLLTSPDDPVALAGALGRLLDDGALRGAMTAAAQERGRGLPTWADAGLAFRDVLDAAIRERG